MIKNCPVCGKAFEVPYPDLWRYKRDKIYLCTYTCLRALDDKRGMNRDMKLTEKQRETVIEMALRGESPVKFIEQCGINNPSCTWWNLKKYLSKNEPETYNKLPDKFKGVMKKLEIPEKPAAVEVPEGPSPTCCQPARPIGVTVPDQLPERPKAIEYRVTGISTEAGDFQYFRKQGFLDWTTLDGTAVSMSLAEWAALMRVFPEVSRVLGVEM